MIIYPKKEWMSPEIQDHFKKTINFQPSICFLDNLFLGLVTWNFLLPLPHYLCWFKVPFSPRNAAKAAPDARIWHGEASTYSGQVVSTKQVG